jgi:hypothetical protein
MMLEKFIECLASRARAFGFQRTRLVGLFHVGCDGIFPPRLPSGAFPDETRGTRSAFRSTLDRLLAFAESRPVTAVVGCHIEMTTQPGVDYPIRTTYHPPGKGGGDGRDPVTGRTTAAPADPGRP